MALTANANYRLRHILQNSVQVVNAAQNYQGSLLALGNRDHATAASIGRITPWAGTAGQIPYGFAKYPALGNTALTPPTSGEVDLSSRIISNVAVTGLAGTFADVGLKVYASDDNTFTTVAPAAPNVQPVGMVAAFVSGTNADVLFFGAVESALLSMAGAGREVINLGHFDYTSASTLGGGGGANIRTGWTFPYHGRILGTFAMVDVALGGAGGALTVGLEIDTTNVTGGTISLPTGTAAASRVNGAAVTATNVFRAGSVLDVEASAGVAGTSGSFDLFALVEKELGL